MFVRIRYEVMSNALLPGIDAEGEIQNLQYFVLLRVQYYKNFFPQHHNIPTEGDDHYEN